MPDQMSMPTLRRQMLIIKAEGDRASGKTTALLHTAQMFRDLGFQVDDSGATKEHHILVFWPTTRAPAMASDVGAGTVQKTA